jgi:hypothetical protein
MSKSASFALLGQFDFPKSAKLPLTEDDKPGFTVSAVCPLKGPRVEKSRVNVDLGRFLGLNNRSRNARVYRREVNECISMYRNAL